MRHRLIHLLYAPLRGVNALTDRALKMRVVRHGDLYPWQVTPYAPAPDTTPIDAAGYLSAANPRLVELQASYKRVDPRVTRPAVWVEGKLADADLRAFRGHNPYLNQASGLNYNELAYALTYYALKSGGQRALLERLGEDGAFGAHTFAVDGRLISRDLLDSVREIEFIQTHVGLDAPDTNILDIGAGYGRLVYRLTQASGPNVRAFATDAFAPSTFLAEYYFRFRDADRAAAVPLPEVEGFLADTRISLAINIHSFSECTVDAIHWWMEHLAAAKVPNLLVIPNAHDRRTGECLTNQGENIDRILEQHGYVLRVREPRFSDPVVQRWGVDPTWLHLFTLKSDEIAR